MEKRVSRTNTLEGLGQEPVRVSRRGLVAAAALGAAAWAGPRAAGQTAPSTSEPNLPGKTPNTRFAVNVEMWFGNLPFLDRVRAAAELGFPALEFWPYQDKPLTEFASLRRELGIAVSQFTAWGFGSELNHPAADHGKFETAIQESCDVADQLDCHLFTVVVGNDIEGVSKQEMHAAAIRGLKRVAPLCENRKKVIIIEPMNPRDHPGHCLYGGEDAIAICRTVDSPSVRINWDLYHMQIVDGDLCMRLREGFPYIGYLQLADNPGRHEPGTGEVNYRRVLREIQSLGYDGYVGLECVPSEDERTAAQRIYQADTF